MTKKEELRTELIEDLSNLSELFCTVVEALDGYNGFADGHRIYDMYDLDDLFYGMSPTDIIRAINYEDFNINDNYIVDTIYGLESTWNKAEYYYDTFSCEEVLNELAYNNNYTCIDFLEEDWPEFWDMLMEYINIED